LLYQLLLNLGDSIFCF